MTQAGGPPADGLRRMPACDLITREEMTAILGTPIGTPTVEDSADTAGCLYPPGGAGSYAQAQVTIDWQYSGGRTFGRQLADAFGGSAAGRKVARRVDLGDESTYDMGGVLSVKLGSALITVTVPMRAQSEEHALAIGQKIVDRLRGAGHVSAANPDSAAPVSADDPLSILSQLAALVEDDEKKPDAPGKDDTGATPAVAPPMVEGVALDAVCAEPSLPATDIKTSLSPKIPMAPGLTLSSIWVRRGDDAEHECLVQVVGINAAYVDVTQACSGTGPPSRSTYRRRVCRADLRDGFSYVTVMSTFLPEVIGGATMFSLSDRSFRELKTQGKTRHRYRSLADGPRTNGPPRLVDSEGTLTAGPFEPYRVIVNDRVVELPTILALGHRATEDEVNIRVLDDDAFPLVLDYHRPGWGFRVHYTKISFPTGGEMEKQLASEKRVDVYGIYFDFASDRLRPESEPVLREIAGVLAKNAAWTLTINGHTDNVGGAAFNLDLSRRRSESVRRALVEGHQVDRARLMTSGFGASQPKEDNATVESRAKNRRVELVRQ